MGKIGEKSETKHPGSENLTPGGPGRPKGQRNYATIYREALIKLASMNDMEPEEMETDILLKGLASARKGDYRFWKDLHDRLHGQSTQKTDLTTGGEKITFGWNAYNNPVQSEEVGD